ncbi:uncharacterized protein LOC128225591 [Mya arenaria]|uniref:uncharacterized protein LOC128225591 n=1 Tax=Mya arenaria TaxID=6604 RepID=UPI0022E58607|nr:uncharacterized protein LOC128225591 [Mya arenaria]
MALEKQVTLGAPTSAGGGHPVRTPAHGSYMRGLREAHTIPNPGEALCIFVSQRTRSGQQPKSRPPYSNPIYGAEYQTWTSAMLASLHDHDVPCAVCAIQGGSTVMIPARDKCYSGWKPEYSGYLMSERETQTASKDFVCMDKNAEVAEASSETNQDGALFFFVDAKCGSLKCPPYVTGRTLTCVVCSPE